MADRKTLLLLDGHSLAYRAFFALPDTLATRTGQVTNAVYGFTSMLIKMWTDRRPDGIAVMFDKGRDAQRMAEYPEYKAGRAETPDIFRSQLGLMRDVLEVLRIPVIEVANVEADDVIATVADAAVADGWHAFVVTGDRDAMQLSAEHVTILYNLRGITEVGEMTPDAVEEKYGIPPSRYVEYAALRGDNSDNLPGVPGVGEKTAAKLINQFGSLPELFENLDQVSGKKVPAMLEEHQEQVLRNERIMTLRRDVEVTYDLADMEMRTEDLDLDAIREVFGALEFRALYDRFTEDVLGEVEQEQASVFAGTPARLDGGEVADWFSSISTSTGPDGAVAVLPIVTGEVPRLQAVAWAFAGKGADPASIASRELTDVDRKAIADALADPDVPIATHDAKALEHLAMQLGWSVRNLVMDTELAAYLKHPEQRSFDLERLSLQELSRSVVGEDASSGGDQLSLEVEEDPWEERARRAQAVGALATHLRAELDARDQSDLLFEIELPLAPVLARMERAGIALDRHVLEELHERMTTRATELEQEIWDHAGHEFKVGSGQQLQVVLFEELGLTKTKKIKTGWSTDATQLGNIAHEHDIVAAVLEWREVTKLLSTYVDALPPLMDPDTGRIHTTLSQTVAATGRLSSSNPNLQNIPVRREEGREIRKAFVPGEGFDHLLVADYSQIELRIMAHLSQDEGLLEAFLSDEDIHATTAAKVFDLPLEDVDGALRDRAKAVNYGLAYGLSAFGLGQQLGIPPGEAQEIVDAYMDRFPGIANFLGQAVEDARREGWTTTMFGRRRYLPDLLSGNRQRRQMAERMALNAPIQGTAADVIKLAMIRVDAALQESGMRSQMLLQVHDEVILECPDSELEDARALVERELAGVAELAVPLVVDSAHGPTWFDAQKH